MEIRTHRPARSKSTSRRYQRLTSGVEVEVESKYRPEQSSPEDEFYYFTYRIQILNHREEKIKLLRRHWTIKNQHGRIEEVEGEGVVGQCPIILPGRAFTYTSACPLDTAQGEMCGFYQMYSKDIGNFTIEIPRFYLGRPLHLRLVKS